MCAAVNISNLTVDPPCRRFGPDDESAFHAWLSQRILTEPVSIRGPQELFLSPDGCVQGDYRFTKAALTQLCQLLGPGLGSYVTSLVRMRDLLNGSSQTRGPAFVEAIRVLNEAIRLRYDVALADRHLVLDSSARLIEGIVGPRYHYFSNLALYERARQLAGETEFAGVFHAAVVHGRRIFLQFRKTDRLFAVPTPSGRREPFHGGWHFSNSEIGDCRAIATIALIRKWTGTASLLPLSDLPSARHVQGRRFLQQLERQESALQQKLSELEHLQPRILALQQQRLGLGSSDHEARAHMLAAQLVRCGKFSMTTAQEIILRAVAYGSYRASRLDSDSYRNDMTTVSPDLAQIISQRNAYDLYNATLHVGATKSPRRAEEAAQVAHRLLLGQISLS